MMFHAVLFIGDDRAQVDILHTLENVSFYKGIGLLQGSDQVLDLHTFGGTAAIGTAGGTGIGKTACTLDKMQIVVISPVFDVVLADQIHGTDQLHALEIRAVQLRHHGLHLSTVQHPHEDRLNHIIVMVSQSDLITPQLLCVTVEIASAHSRTQIAGAILDIIHRIKYLGFKNRDGNVHQLRIVLDDLAVRLTVTGIHH